MNKRRLHHLWTKFRALNPWYFVVLAVVSGVICIIALRSNNEHMVRLRSAVYSADKDNGNVEQALNNLRSYVNSHMNTDLTTPDGVYPPIQLKYTYDRLVQAESAKVAQTNSQLYTQAENYCQQQVPDGFSGRYRIPCVTQYIDDHGAQTSAIPDALYKFDFASPAWSPDLAGWSLVVFIVSAVVAVVLLALKLLFKRAKVI
ncbi:MAG TPA: hypothetical protein VF261_01140 [Candidatus Saccharimonadales bacterium]